MDSLSPPRLRVAFLGSGSSGNATAIVYEGRCVLVDCGFSARETLRRLEGCGIERSSVEAILLTHEHGDHVRGADVLARRYGIPLFATEGTLRVSGLAGHAEGRVRAETITRVGPFEVRAFATSHDVAEPVGFAFRSPCGGSFGIATDTGILTEDALEALSGCDLVGLETNHDVEMLRNGPYPAFLKARILSSRGHLSNAAAADALVRLAAGRTRRVVAMHLSNTNNTRRAALAALRARVTGESLRMGVEAVGQNEPHVPEAAA